MAIISREEFQRLYSDLLSRCGQPKVRPREAQCEAWYQQNSHRSEEVIRKAFRIVESTTEHMFPSNYEWLEAIRIAESQERREVDTGGNTCRKCGDSGLIRLEKVDEMYYPPMILKGGGRPYLGRCSCPIGREKAARLSEVYPGAIDGNKVPMHTAAGKKIDLMVAIEEMKSLLKDAKVEEG